MCETGRRYRLSRILFFNQLNSQRGEDRGILCVMKRLSFLLLLVLACTVFATEAIAAKKVAVYAEGEIPNSTKSIVCSSVLSRLSGNKDYKAFERNSAFVNALDKEQDYQTSGDVPEKEIREVAQRMGVDYVIVVNTVVSADEQCHMSARLIDLVTGEILKTVNLKREYTGSEVISSMANNLAYRLINNNSK